MLQVKGTGAVQGTGADSSTSVHEGNGCSGCIIRQRHWHGIPFEALEDF